MRVLHRFRSAGFNGEAGERTQTHVYDCLGLRLGEAEAFRKSCAGLLGGLRCLDYLDYLVDILNGNHQTFKDVRTIFGLTQEEFCPAGHNFATVVVECLTDFFEVEGFGGGRVPVQRCLR